MSTTVTRKPSPKTKLCQISSFSIKKANLKLSQFSGRQNVFNNNNFSMRLSNDADSYWLNISFTNIFNTAGKPKIFRKSPTRNFKNQFLFPRRNPSCFRNTMTFTADSNIHCCIILFQISDRTHLEVKMIRNRFLFKNELKGAYNRCEFSCWLGSIKHCATHT